MNKIVEEIKNLNQLIIQLKDEQSYLCKKEMKSPRQIYASELNALSKKILKAQTRLNQLRIKYWIAAQ